MGKGHRKVRSHSSQRPGILSQVLIDQSIVAQEMSEIEVKDDVKTKGSSKNLDTYGDSPQSGILILSIW